MLIYNVTVKVEWAIHDAWVKWMKEEHMPEIIATGCYTKYLLLQLLESDDAEGATYTAQYFANSNADYNRYIELFSVNIRQKAFDRWGNRFIAFRSLMQIVQ